ncbi:general secretion pathway protein GspK [Azoarcus sp. L1K30]|uniref:general secretion pathway protein GspK n=1 Tax=Azoarcus sp. L1K30 TaxID=2820277 RepID=UPI001B820CCC|nr:type II secretion system protein GspK [Azoarcus sp. L1K30]MBR0567247.1 general secretion pathway protein GspK [Azoarcus sp. L1K30]
MRRHTRRARARGLALIAVLWMVAALSLIVTGLIYTMRGELRVVSTQRNMSEGAALGDGAIRLIAAQLSAAGDERNRYREVQVDFDGHAIDVTVVPLNGLIDLSAASSDLLEQLFVIAAGVEPDAARMLADRIVDWRDADDVPRAMGAEDPAYIAAGSHFLTRGNRFEAVEDLLQVLGVDIGLYGRVASFVTVDGRHDKVDPMAAPFSVLVVLAGGNVELAKRIFEARTADANLADTTGLNPANVARSSASRFRIEARVPLSSGATMVRTQEIDVSVMALQRVPWRVLRTGQRLEPTIEPHSR